MIVGSWQPSIVHAHSREVSALALAGTSDLLVSGSADKTVRLWQVVNGGNGKSCSPLQCLKGHTDSVAAVAVSADGFWLASASWDATLRVWLGPGSGHACSGDACWLVPGSGEDECVSQPLDTHGCAVTAVAIAQQAKGIFASGSRDGTLLVWAWDPLTSQTHPTAMCRIRAHTDKVASIVVSTDGRWVASGGRDDHVRLHCCRTGEMLCEDKTHTDNVAGLSICTIGRAHWLASGAHDNTVRLWRA